MEVKERGVSMIPFEFHEEIDYDGHEAWFVDHLHTLESPDYFLSTYSEANTQGMIYGAQKIPLPGSKGSEWRNINYVKILICPIVVTSESERSERQARFDKNIPSLISNFDEIWTGLKSELIERYRPFKEFDMKGASSLDLVRELAHLKPVVFRMSEVHFYVMYIAFSVFMMFEDLCQELFGINAGHPDFHAMVSGFDNRSFQCERGLWELSQMVAEFNLGKTFELKSEEIAGELQGSANGKAWLKKLDEFIDEFGWRNERLWTISAPSWRDDPCYVIDRVKVYLKKQVGAPGEKLKELAKRREDKVAEFRSRVTNDKKEQFELLLEGAQKASMYSEEHDLYCEMQTDALVRMYFLEIGKRFVSSGTLNEVSDIFCLTFDEIRMIGMYPEKYRLQSLIETRKEKGAENVKQQLPNVLSKKMNEQEAFGWMMQSREPIFTKVVVGELPGPKPALKADLVGVAGSSGEVEGIARILTSVEQLNEIQPGEILVALTTSITWTPVFSMIGGAVLDRGGTLSHAAVICREYGIPCVLNTFEATSKIKTGQRIRVDGNEGAVYILD